MFLVLGFCFSSLLYAQSALLIRHGEALHNLQDLHNGDIKGSLCFPLTSNGQLQVKQTSQDLRQLGYSRSTVSALYVSPCLRTVESARILKEALGLLDTQVIETPFLTGSWRGKLEGQKRRSEGYDPALHAADVEGESYTDLALRLYLFLSEVCKRDDSQDVIFVSHGTIVRVLEFLLVSLPKSSLTAAETSLLNRWAFPAFLKEKLIDPARLSKRPKNGEMRKFDLTPFCERFKRKF